MTVSNGDNHVGGQDFTGTAWPCIRGTITDGANPLVGVVISDGSSLTATTNENGSFFIPVAGNWSGALAPTLLNYYFIPDRRSYTNVTADQNDQMFTGIPVNIAVDRFTAAWGGITGATGYFLDVATDPGFTRFVPGYQNRQAGDVTQVVVTGLSPLTHYFYRVRARDSFQTIWNSTVTEVQTNAPWAYYFPIVGR